MEWTDIYKGLLGAVWPFTEFSRLPVGALSRVAGRRVLLSRARERISSELKNGNGGSLDVIGPHCFSCDESRAFAGTSWSARKGVKDTLEVQG